MVVYGGVGSYSTALYNDMWLYNFVERSWFQLQASFVPPFPAVNPRNPEAQVPEGPVAMFRPSDTPPEPPLREDPSDNKPIAVPVGGTAGLDPVFQPAKQKPLEVVTWETVFDATGSAKPPGYSFIEEVAATSPNQQLDFFRKTLRSSHTRKETRPHPSERAAGERSHEHVRRRHALLLEIHAASRARQQAEPAKFWKSDALSPKLMSPFIAADLWAYDIDLRVWQNLKSKSRDIPAPRWLHTAVAVGEKMVVFGGVSYSDIILGDVWMFDVKKLQWLQSNPKGDAILPREGHSAVVVQKTKMYVFGGISYGHIPFNDVWEYNTAANSWKLVKTKGEGPPPRWMHTASVHKDDKGKERMFVFGGVTRNYIPLSDLWILDIAKNTWQHPVAKTLPPYPRMLHTAMVVNSLFLVFGGMANNIPLEDTWVYSLADQTWEEEYNTNAYPFAREGASIVAVVPEKFKGTRPKREKWNPPMARPPGDNDLSPEVLMPTIKKWVMPRPAQRIRKIFNDNRFLILFGGAGPKPL